MNAKLKFSESDIKPLLIAVANYLEWKQDPRAFVREPIFNLIVTLRELMQRCDDQGIQHTALMHHRFWDHDFEKLQILRQS